ncbi:MAG: methyltransferase domain-containing protein [Bacillus sp. (in: firmicutes)]
MSYGKFAHVYDILMENVPYDQWISLFLKKMNQYQIQGREVLDIACGTGEFTVRLAEHGYDVSGIDMSDDMLFIANEKATEAALNIPFFHQNMAELELEKTFDAVVIFCDSLNYLENEEDVKRTFRGVYEHLKPGGLFLFDVHSIYKMEQIFQNNTFADPYEEVSYIWNSYAGEEPYSAEHELSFFVKDEGTGLYERFEEDHYQRTFPIETYQAWLKEAGFVAEEVLADLEEHPPNGESERIFFVATKPN